MDQSAPIEMAIKFIPKETGSNDFVIYDRVSGRPFNNVTFIDLPRITPENCCFPLECTIGMLVKEIDLVATLHTLKAVDHTYHECRRIRLETSPSYDKNQDECNICNPQ